MTNQEAEQFIFKWQAESGRKLSIEQFQSLRSMLISHDQEMMKKLVERIEKECWSDCSQEIKKLIQEVYGD